MADHKTTETEKETEIAPSVRQEAAHDIKEEQEAARARRHKRRVRQQVSYTLIALILLAVIGCGIWFGGRMLYRSFFAEDKPLRAQPEGAGETAASGSGDAAGQTTPKTEDDLLNDRVNEILSQMSLEDKVASLFVVTAEQLTGNPALTGADRTLEDALMRYPVAGIVFSASNFSDGRQMSSLLSGAQRMSRYPLFLGVSETGGSMSAVADALKTDRQAAPQDMGALANPATARAVGEEIGTYLKETGFNLNLAPYASLSQGTAADVIYGDDAETVAGLSGAFTAGERAAGLFAAVGSFPVSGEQDAGGTPGVTTTSLTMTDLTESAFVPFQSCIEEGAEIIITSNISASRALGASVNIPCSISEAMVTGQLRGVLQFEGIVMTAPFDQDVITEGYTSDHVAVAAIVAGADLIYRPQDLSLAHAGIMEAVENGVITEERINQSLRRTLRIKLRDAQ